MAALEIAEAFDDVTNPLRQLPAAQRAHLGTVILALEKSLSRSRGRRSWFFAQSQPCPALATYVFERQTSALGIFVRR